MKYLTFKENKIYEYKVKSSKFISYCYYVENQEQINEHLNLLKKEHNKAKHICYSYRLTNNQIKIYEDNEPSNSSGKKIYDVIENNDLYNVLIVVVRYMDKSKLGLGLLTRSYFGAANLTIENQNIAQLIKTKIFSIKVPFEKYNFIINLLIKNNETILYKITSDNECEIISTLDKTNINFQSCLLEEKYVKKI